MTTFDDRVDEAVERMGQYLLRVTLPDGCYVEYEPRGVDGYPYVQFYPVAPDHEHPNDPESGYIHRAAGQAFLDAVLRPSGDPA